MSEGQANERQVHDPWRNAYDAVPRDGPAVFAADAAGIERGEWPRGRWLNPLAPTPKIERQLAEVFGPQAQPGEWIIVDQYQLGPVMVPEELSVRALHRFAVRARRHLKCQ
jgi:hypothetical protein